MTVVLNLVGSTANCKSDCPAHIHKWLEWAKTKIAQGNLALLPVGLFYKERLDGKSRYMIRKTHRLDYTYKPFIYNDELDSIYEINTSKPVRQGKHMTAAYMHKPEPTRIADLCTIHDYTYLGGYQNNTLKAYCAIAVMNELAILNTIIGHAAALPDGVMNGLINYINDYCVKNIPTVRYVNYLTLESSKEGLASFKRSVGFSSTKVELGEIT